MHASFSKSISRLEGFIAYTFKQKDLLVEALTHKSFTNEKKNLGCSFNERLEFLGDAVLSLVISEHLFTMYPAYSEAELSKIRAYTVQENSLAEAADKLHIGSFLRMGKGEVSTGGRKKSSLLANAFEAILGAIYIDGGIRNAKKFVLQHLQDKVSARFTGNLMGDFKTRFQEFSQSQYGALPRYVLEYEKGPDHEKSFTVSVFINDHCFGSGTGSSKKAAEQKAAQAGLIKMQGMK